MGPFKRFRDIPQFTGTGSYAVDVGWEYLEHQLISMSECLIMETDPDFQRAHVWSLEKQIAYVEYSLRGGRAAREIIWNCANWQRDQVPPDDYAAKLVLVDGKQRLEAVRKFIRDELPAFGNLFSEYEGNLRIMNSRLIFYINDLKSRAEILQWYIDLNSGGVVHTDDEIDRVKALLEAE
jgi:hypothetical protein